MARIDKLDIKYYESIDSMPPEKQAPVKKKKEDRVIYNNTPEDLKIWDFLININRAGMTTNKFIKRCILRCVNDIEAGTINIMEF